MGFLLDRFFYRVGFKFLSSSSKWSKDVKFKAGSKPLIIQNQKELFCSVPTYLPTFMLMTIPIFNQPPRLADRGDVSTNDSKFEAM